MYEAKVVKERSNEQRQKDNVVKCTLDKGCTKSSQNMHKEKEIVIKESNGQAQTEEAVVQKRHLSR